MLLSRTGTQAGSRSGERGASSSTGVVLMIATTLLLAGVAGVTALGMNVLVPAAPQASFGYEFTDDGGADSLVVEHDAGDAIDGDRLVVVVSGATPASADGRYRWSGESLGGPADVRHGSWVRLNATTVGDGSTLDLEGATVTLVWTPPGDGSSLPVSRWTGPTAASTPTPTPTPTATPAPTPTPTPGEEEEDEDG